MSDCYRTKNKPCIISVYVNTTLLIKTNNLEFFSRSTVPFCTYLTRNLYYLMLKFLDKLIMRHHETWIRTILFQGEKDTRIFGLLIIDYKCIFLFRCLTRDGMQEWSLTLRDLSMCQKILILITVILNVYGSHWHIADFRTDLTESLFIDWDFLWQLVSLR